MKKIEPKPKISTINYDEGVIEDVNEDVFEDVNEDVDEDVNEDVDGDGNEDIKEASKSQEVFMNEIINCQP